jgi:hypothetical protein
VRLVDRRTSEDSSCAPDLPRAGLIEVTSREPFTGSNALLSPMKSKHDDPPVLEWIGFYDDERLHEAIGDMPPTEYEELDNYKTDNSGLVATT